MMSTHQRQDFGLFMLLKGKPTVFNSGRGGVDRLPSRGGCVALAAD